MKPTNKYLLINGIIVLCCFLIILNETESLVPSEYYGNIQIKKYDENIDLEGCYSLLGKLPEKYLGNLKYIKVYHNGTSKVFWGYYWPNQNGMQLFMGCNKEAFIHELAHHCQQQIYGDNSWQVIWHRGHFNICLNELKSIYYE